MTKKYEKCIVKEPKIIDQFQAHVPGKYQIMMDSEMVPESDFFIAAGIHHKIYQAEPIAFKPHMIRTRHIYTSQKKGMRR